MEETLYRLLATARQIGASDVHVKSNAVPRMRVNGALRILEMPPAEPTLVASMIASVLSEQDHERYRQTGEADFAVVDESVGRFRVNAYRERGGAALVARAVAGAPKTLDALGLPGVLKDLAMNPRGLILVTGPTGSGKTTSLAAMIDHINDRRAVHIVTVEDPIEVLHVDKKASVSQRELGIDTMSWKAAMRAAMRQDPDVILIGEMRDRDTVHAALEAAETGHLVMSTLHTSTVVDTVARVLDFYPADEQKQIRAALSGALRGILCQRLIPTVDGAGRMCVLEIGVNTGSMAEAIADPDKTADIPDIIEAGRQYGMQVFDQHLTSLVVSGKARYEDAVELATSRNDFMVRLRQAGFRP